MCPRTETSFKVVPTVAKTCPSQTSFKELAKSDIILMRILFSQRKQTKLLAQFLPMTVRLHIKLMHQMWKSNDYYICMLEDCLNCIWTKSLTQRLYISSCHISSSCQKKMGLAFFFSFPNSMLGIRFLFNGYFIHNDLD